MTNEQLAIFIKQGGNDELIPILWERIKKIMYIKSDKTYSALQGRFIQCGVEVWDLKQCCYMAFLKAIQGYKPDSGLKFTSYLSYPFKTAVSELLGCRTQKDKHEPLNDCISLDKPLKEDETDSITIADTIADNNAVNALETVEIADEYRILHEVVNALTSPMNIVINAYFFDNRTLQSIGDELGTDRERVRQIKLKALQILRNSAELRELYTA